MVKQQHQEILDTYSLSDKKQDSRLHLGLTYNADQTKSETSMAQYQVQRTTGTLHVKVVKANRLKDTDITTGKTDPYVTYHLTTDLKKAQMKKTKQLNDTLDPLFDDV